MILYSDCSKLPLSVFIRCTVHGDLSALADDDGADEIALRAAWLAINSEYVQIVEDKETKAFLNRQVRMTYLYYRILLTAEAVDKLRLWFDARTAELLREDGFDFAFDPADPEQYEKDLNRVLVALKADEIELEQLEAMEQQQEEEQEQKQRTKITEAHFDDLLMEIYQHLIHAVVTDLEQIKEEMKSRTYAHYIKRLRKHYARPQQPKTAY